MTQDRIAAHVHRCLEAMRDYHTSHNAAINKAMRDGRIISGGQLHGDDWEITDWRTGNLIANGSTGIEGWDETIRELDPNETWIHIDNVFCGISIDPVESIGIPASLGAAIEDWVENASDEDIAGIAGWTVEKVREHRTPGPGHPTAPETASSKPSTYPPTTSGTSSAGHRSQSLPPRASSDA